MDRRRFLAAVAGGTVAGLGGCATLSGDGGEARPASDGRGDDSTADGPETDGTGAGGGEAGSAGGTRTGNGSSSSRRDAETVPGENGYPADICQRPILDDPGIYAITDPAFGSDWSGAEVADYYVPDRAGTGTAAGDGRKLRPDQTVVGLEVGELARAYPVSVLRYHEIVNDDVGRAVDDLGSDGEDDAGATGPVVVTYCPLCLSGVVASRIVDGAATTFAVTGQLWRPPRLQVRMAEEDGRTFGARDTGGETVTVRPAGNLVMYDAATRSYWSQVTAEAICGPAAGTTLDIVPSTVATWSEWRRNHPGTEVLLPPPHSTTTRDGDVPSGTPTTGVPSPAERD